MASNPPFGPTRRGTFEVRASGAATHDWLGYANLDEETSEDSVRSERTPIPTCLFISRRKVKASAYPTCRAIPSNGICVVSISFGAAYQTCRARAWRLVLTSTEGDVCRANESSFVLGAREGRHHADRAGGRS